MAYHDRRDPLRARFARILNAGPSLVLARLGGAPQVRFEGLDLLVSRPNVSALASSGAEFSLRYFCPAEMIAAFCSKGPGLRISPVTLPVDCRTKAILV